MKKILIVSAHPEEASFCMSLKKVAKDHFLIKGWEVKESNLYKMNFDPVGNKSDFKSVSNLNFFKYQTEQLNAFQNNLFADQLKEEMEKLEWCDVLIFNFPLWWFGLPAILKGWVDRVFAMGFVYGGGKGTYENGIFKEKTAIITMTTGGPEYSYAHDGKNGNIESILFPIHHGMFYFTGMTVLEPFISWSPARANDLELKTEIDRYKQYLCNFTAKNAIYTNRKPDVEYFF